MEIKRSMQEECEELFRAKLRRRRELARLPFDGKIRILVELQRMASDIRATLGGRKRHPWNIP
jgi:hypothetical protein